jgi:pyruvate formate-lyase/glycerol dehydratase family glycyl radical enzyme
MTAFRLREVSGEPSTRRVAHRYRELLDNEPYIDAERAVLLTEYMDRNWTSHSYTRAGGSLRHVLSNMTPRIWDGELVVGNISRYLRGTQVYPEYETWMLEAFKNVRREEERYTGGTLVERKGDRLGIYRIHPEDKDRILQVAGRWEGKDWRTLAIAHLRATMPDFDQVEQWQQQLVFLRFMYDVPEGRVIVDYQKVVDQGLDQLIAVCRRKMQELSESSCREDFDRHAYYEGTVLALQGMIEFAERHAAEARRLAEACKDPARQNELLEIARICSTVPRNPARSFREAVQAFWFTHVCLFVELNGRGISPGRMDQYLWPTLQRDLAQGRITEAEALELLELLRIKMAEITRAHAMFTESYLGGSIYQNVTVGGVDANGRCADNRLSQLILQAGINVRTWQPTISVRWGEQTSEALKLKSIECIKAGSGYPALFADELGTRRFVMESGASLQDARDWAPCGCVDMQIVGRRMPMYAVPHTNMLKIFELVLGGGVNPVTGDTLVQSTLELDHSSFEQIVAEYKRVMAVVAARQERYWNAIMLVHNACGLVHLLQSALLDDCLERGVDAYQGGCRYSDSPYVITCGLINVVNSLAAIRKVVFEDEQCTMAELRRALRDDFADQELLRRRLLQAPKYGNDDDSVDALAVELYDAWSEAAQVVPNWVGSKWRPSTLSVTSQVLLGKACGASADGRKAREYLADGALSAFPGTDSKGPTGLIKSATKVHADKLQSTLFNMKMHPASIEGELGAAKFMTLIDTYFRLGGYHVQFNVVDRGMLVDAQQHPDKYGDLMVRVAGFTARFVDLGPDIQRQIIDRTEFGAI